MKIKSLAMLACSGLLAATVAYVAPAFADDTMDNQSSQSSSDSDQSQSSSDQTQSSADSNSDSNGSSSDSATPDTTSGDDDY